MPSSGLAKSKSNNIVRFIIYIYILEQMCINASSECYKYVTKIMKITYKHYENRTQFSRFISDLFSDHTRGVVNSRQTIFNNFDYNWAIVLYKHNGKRQLILFLPRDNTESKRYIIIRLYAESPTRNVTLFQIAAYYYSYLPLSTVLLQ